MNDPARHWYIILKGEAAVYKSRNAKEITFETQVLTKMLRNY
jgi:hypothetical protein